MKLYHGSLEIVEKPQIRLANRTLDYGMLYMREVCLINKN